MTKIEAEKLIAKHAGDKDATVKCLVTEARNFVRKGDYASVGQILAPAFIAAQKNLW